MHPQGAQGAQGAAPTAGADAGHHEGALPAGRIENGTHEEEEEEGDDGEEELIVDGGHAHRGHVPGIPQNK